MDLSELILAEDELREAIATVDLSGVEWPLCTHYVTSFGRAIDLYPPLRAPLQFLAIVCGWHLRPDDPESPFDPAIVTETIRSPAWHQVSDAQVNVVAAVALEVVDAELRARLCDLVWLRERNHSLARAAAEAYVRSTERLVADRKIIGEKERLMRAVQLAAQLGRGDDFFLRIIDNVAAIADTPQLPHCSLAICMDVLLDARSGDANRLHALVTARASEIEATEPNPLWERRFWKLASGFARILKDTALSDAALRKVATTFEREAEGASVRAVAAHFWHCALQAYRQIGAQDDIARVHRQMLDAQSHIRSEMISLDAGPVDLTEIVSESRKRILPDDKDRSLASLVFATQWLLKADVREKAKATITEFPFQHMFGSIRVTQSGKTAANAPGVVPSATEIPDDRVIAEMCQQYRYYLPIVTNGRIEPMRYELLHRHAVTLDDIAQFVHYSPFVPPGREPLFVVGLHAGVHGRFIEAVHTLVLQLENSIRFLLVQNGSIASSVRTDGVQNEYDLNRLLTMSETESLLGEDLAFAMRVLFTERFGYNLRNEMAHGMLEPGAFFADSAIYAWWLILRFVSGPAAHALLSAQSS